MTQKPKVERGYQVWHFSWPDLSPPLVVRAARAKVERDGALRVELTPYEVEHGESNILAAPAPYNISGPVAKKQAREALHARYESSEDFSWSDALEYIAMQILDDLRTGDPPVKVRDVGPTGKSEYLIYPFLPRNETTVLLSDNSSGKSALAQFACWSVATGARLPHWSQPVETGPVLYLDYEHSGPGETANRFRWIANGLGQDELPENLHVLNLQYPIVEEHERIRGLVERMGIQLVVLDSLGWASHDDPNEQRTAIGMMNAIRSIGCTSLTVAHINKADRANPNSRRGVAGSIFYEHGARSVWELRAKREQWGLLQSLYHRKQNNAALRLEPWGFKLVFSGPVERACMELEGTVIEQPSQESVEDKVVAILARAKRAVTAAEIARAINEKPAKVNAALKSLPNVVNQAGVGGPGAWGLEDRLKQLQGQLDEQVEVCGKCGTAGIVSSYQVDSEHPDDASKASAICVRCAA